MKHNRWVCYGSSLCVLLALATLHGAAPSPGRAAVPFARTAHAVPPVIALPAAIENDNRVPAGTLRDGVLTLKLVAQWSAWTLNSKTARALPMLAFAEEGHAPTIPGPVIRVPAGTRIRVSVHNPLPDSTIVVRGLAGHESNQRDSMLIAPGATVEREFMANAPGTYYYWGSMSGVTTPFMRFGFDSQLNGAFVVDPPGAPPHPDDRILLITLWSDSTNADNTYSTAREFWAINGHSWPETERLAYTLGDSIRWRVINASADVHPMHLHGFYFRVDSRGLDVRDTVYGASERRMAVTEKLLAGTSMAMTWAPDRVGGWIFHCHITYHVGPLPEIVGQPAPHESHDPNQHTVQSMGGLMMAIDVGAPRVARAAAPASSATRRPLRLVIHADSTPADSLGRRFTAILQEGARAPSRDSMRAMGSPLVLHRGEPTTITVVNESGEPTAIHWHGIELESYYDGVVGLGGTSALRTKPIMPSDSFQVRITAPRAGTFMYHTHFDDVRQQNGGLYGSLVVLEPGATRDAEHDLSILAANDHNNGVLVNGSLTPAPLTWHVGHTYRLRIGNITTGNPNLSVRLVRGAEVLEWRLVARDGFELPASKATLGPARFPFSNGEIRDVLFTPDRAGPLLLEFYGLRKVNATQPITVVP